MVEVGRGQGGANLPEPYSVQKAHVQKTSLPPTQKMGAAGCNGGLGGNGERATLKLRPGSERS